MTGDLRVETNIMSDYPEISFKIQSAFRQLDQDKVTPWAFLLSNMSPVVDFVGRTIRYSGVAFEGTPQHMFWNGFIEPFLEVQIAEGFQLALDHAHKRNVDASSCILVARNELYDGITSIYRRMQDIDRRLRGKGDPHSLPLHDVKPAILAMHTKVNEYFASAGKSTVEQQGKSMSNDEIPAVFVTHAAGILGDTNLGLSGPQIVKLCAAYALDANVHIPFETYPFSRLGTNKRSALCENILAFPSKWRYKIIRELCDQSSIQKSQPAEAAKLKVQLFSRYGHLDDTNTSENLNQALVEETRHWLSAFPKSLDLYNGALQKHQHGVFNRNVLDDLRLSLETLLHGLLNNHKSLENQLPGVGAFIKEREGSTELANMFSKLLEYYSKYQNTYVKHDSAVVEEEVEFVFEITSCFMRHLVRIYGGNRK